MSDKPKFRCHVYGCTIPAGIFHEHDRVAENYAAVMRDPVAPLTADERAELESFRREALLREYANEQLARNKRREALYAQATAMQNAYPSSGAQQNSRFNTDEQRMQNHRDAALFQIEAMKPPSITIERQLTDAITYGFGVSQDGKHIPARDVYVVPADAQIHGGRKLTQALLEAGRIRRENADLGVVFDEAPAPRRSFVSTTARVAFWIVVVAIVGIWIFAGVRS